MFYNSGLEQSVYQLREKIDYRKKLNVEEIKELVEEIKEQVDEEMSYGDNIDELTGNSVISEMDTIIEYIDEGILNKDRLEKIIETVEELIDYSDVAEDEED